MDTLLIGKDEVRELADIDLALKAVEAVFIEKIKGLTKSAPKPFLKFDGYNGDVATMTTFLPSRPVAGLKIITYHEKNPLRNLPTIMATIILLDPETGYPISIMDGTDITTLRTGAAGGVGAKYLARKNSRRVAVIGAGVQGRIQLTALSRLFDLEQALIFDRVTEASRKFASEMEERLKIPVKATSTLAEAVTDFDILVTAFPSREPLIKDEWVPRGAHITCIGSDEPGKQELEGSIFKRSRLFVDDYEQTTWRGAINVPLKEGQIKEEDIIGEIGEVISGKKQGRANDSDLTVFVAAGLPIEDIALAWEVYELARKQKIGRHIKYM